MSRACASVVVNRFLAFAVMAAFVVLVASPKIAARQDVGERAEGEPDAVVRHEAFHARYPATPAESIHRVVIDGESLAYLATAGVVTLVDEDGRATADVFTIAYEVYSDVSVPELSDLARDGLSGTALERFEAIEKSRRAGREADLVRILSTHGIGTRGAFTFPDRSERSLTVSFNGGPGSSSVWLHLGIFGPMRVGYADEMGNPGPPPYRVMNNEYSLLDVSDFLFIDPVSTGYSRAAKDGDAKDFHGLESDIASVAEVVRRHVTEHERWSSPKFVAGESYGATRAAGLAKHLHDQHGLAINGVMLISSVMEFSTLRFDAGNDLPYVLFLPAYAATAWYHDRLDAELQALSLGELVERAERFALEEYAPALLQGDRLGESRRAEIVERVARFTGLDEAFIDDANLRVSMRRFPKSLRRDEGLVVGRLDSRFTARDRDDAGESYEFDASYAAILGNYTASLNAWVREGLGFESDLPYEILTNVRPWDFSSAGDNRYTNVAERLRSTMSAQPWLRVFIASGHYDLATPPFATEHTVAHMFLRPEQRERVEIFEYEAGHMMYLHRASLIKLREDLKRWYDDVLGTAALGE